MSVTMDAEQGRSTGVIVDLTFGHKEPDRAAISIGDGMQLGPSRRLFQSSAGQRFIPPLVRPMRRPRWSSGPPFYPQAGRSAVRLQIGSVDHHRLRHRRLCRQPVHHPGEDALVAPSLPSVVEMEWLPPSQGGIVMCQSGVAQRHAKRRTAR